ncbi:hypothetical protein FHG87_000566 [Trinorchestia longiramus]|nr:hypothetical protein FHG87_000566 [Trinorchestia longiramus]
MPFSPSSVILNKYLLPSFGELKLSGVAANYIFIYYLSFMKKLANAAHAEAFKRKRIGVRAGDVTRVAAKLCREFSFRHRRALNRSRSSSESSKASKKSVASVLNPALKGKKSKKTSVSGKEIKRELAASKATANARLKWNFSKARNEDTFEEEESSDVSLTYDGSSDSLSLPGSSSDVF